MQSDSMTSVDNTPLQPVRQRINSLDCARGIAVLGILLLNIIGFALPTAAYLNPAYLGDARLSDKWVWLAMNVFAQGKFLAMFSLLFGASLFMLIPRGSRWIKARLSWLVILGLLHGIFAWDGDILLAYGMVGLVCWHVIYRAEHGPSLLRTGIVLYLIGVGLLLILAVVNLGGKPDEYWLPSYSQMMAETHWKTVGGWLAIKQRSGLVANNMIALLLQYGWQLSGLMLIGAALLRNGWLNGQFPRTHYRLVATILLLVGMALQLSSSLLQWHLDWAYRWCSYFLQLPGELSAPLLALGYLALLYGFWPQVSVWRLTGVLQQIGRMSLSCYLLQTLICTTLFYHLAGFNAFSRLALVMMVFPIWGCCALASVLWLRYFPQGPVEWAWRRLTQISQDYFTDRH